MTLSKPLQLATITSHAQALIELGDHVLDRPIEHCPGWNIGDVLIHLVDVHWFWATIVEERLQEPPDDSRRPSPPARTDLGVALGAAASRLVRVLDDADQQDGVWTWAPRHGTVGFVSRHQVQEIVVHHWDVAHAMGTSFVIDPLVAVDAIEEFLTVSVSSDIDPAEPERASLDGSFALRCTDTGDRWTIRDGVQPGTASFSSGSTDEQTTVAASSSDLLLWLYSRVPLSSSPIDEGVLQRFRDLCFTS